MLFKSNRTPHHVIGELAAAALLWLALIAQSHTVSIVVAVVILPFIQRSSSGIHEEVRHSGHFQPQLLGYRLLHLFTRSFCFFKYGMKSTSLNISEHQTRFLRWSILFRRLIQIKLFTFASCGQNSTYLSFHTHDDYANNYTSHWQIKVFIKSTAQSLWELLRYGFSICFHAYYYRYFGLFTV